MNSSKPVELYMMMVFKSKWVTKQKDMNVGNRWIKEWKEGKRLGESNQDIFYTPMELSDLINN